jgi:AraC-like DNA-binding protein
VAPDTPSPNPVQGHTGGELRALGRVRKSRLGWVPTANGGIARAAYWLACRAHINVESLLENADLTVAQATDPNIRMPVQTQIKFLNFVAHALHDEFLGIRLAKQIDLRELGLLYYAMASSDTLGNALRSVARYSKLHNEGVHIIYREGKDVSVSFQYFGVARQADRHQIEFFVMTLLRICRELTGLDLTPLKIRLVHHRAKFPMEFTNLFGPDVRFNCQIDDVTYAKSAADAPVTKADPYLNSLLVQYFDEALANRPYRSTAWRLKVENAIASHLPHGRPQIEEISRRLGVSPRTLARRLALEGTNFTKVFETLRCDLAKRYLQEGDLPISEVAWLLGYQEPSAFNHAFKRWTSTTPKQARTVFDLSLA